MYYIYKTTNNLNNKIYIGKRKGSPSASAHYLGSGLWIKRAINKHGRDNFTKQILLICENSQVCELECKCIQLYDAQNPEIGYNFADGGEGGDMYKGRGWKEISTPAVYNQRLEKKRERDKVQWTPENRQRLGKTVKQKQWSGEKGLARKKAFSKRFSGAGNPSARTYKIITPEETFIVRGLRTFCRESGLKFDTVRKYVNKGVIERKSKKDTSFHQSETKQRIRGWQIILIEDKNNVVVD